MIGRDIKVGVFVFGALVVFVIGIFAIKDFRFFNPQYSFKVLFQYGDGVKAASPVRIAGVEVGEIKDVVLLHTKEGARVEVYASIKNDIRVPVDSEAFINNLGILGEKYLEIIPGKATSFLKPGDTLKGISATPMFKVSELARETITKIAQIKIDEISEHIASILEDIHKGEGTLGKFLYDDSLYNDLNYFVKDLKAHPWKLLFRSKEK